MKSSLDSYKKWFWCAAVYNACFGTFIGLFPNKIFEWADMAVPNYPWLFQCIGMIVGVYALAYALVAIDPVRYGALMWVGLAGKVLGPIGFVYNAMQGGIPWTFGWMNVTNDLIWIPVFLLFGWRHYKAGHLLPLAGNKSDL